MEIIFGVLQGSILGPLSFNIFVADLFFTINDIDIASYADDNNHILLLIILMIVSNHWKKLQLPYSNGLIVIFLKVILTSDIC